MAIVRVSICKMLLNLHSRILSKKYMSEWKNSQKSIANNNRSFALKDALLQTGQEN